MPIVAKPSTGIGVAPEVYLRCATDHPNQEPLRPFPGTFTLAQAPFLMHSGPALRCFYCHVCGYVEFYLERSQIPALTGLVPTPTGMMMPPTGSSSGR